MGLMRAAPFHNTSTCHTIKPVILKRLKDPVELKCWAKTFCGHVMKELDTGPGQLFPAGVEGKLHTPVSYRASD